MFGFNNLDLFSVGIACAAMMVLGFSIYFNNQKSATTKAFLLLAILASAWSVINYLFYQFSNQSIAFWLLRGEMFLAVWFAFSIFQLLYVFPLTKIDFPSSFRKLLIPIVTLTSLLTLTPFVFRAVASVSQTGQIQTISNGPGIVYFAFVAIGLNVAGIWLLIKKTIKASGEEKKQFKTVLIGVITTLSLILIFNFIFPAFFNDSNFVSFGAVFILPFVVFTSYAIIKHHLLNTKIITTEILTFILAVVTLFEVISSTDLPTTIFRFCIFILMLIFGVLLIKSVLREVEQREQLEVLTKQLGEANEKLKTLDQARAEFITIASHQLRTPPATIKWYLSAVLEGDYGKVPTKILEQLKKTQNTNNHLISLIEDMLNVSRIERGKMEFLFEPTDVEELARFSYEQLLPIAGDKGLKLTYEPPKKPLPKMVVDKEKLRQVMNNLIDNALKYTKEGTVAVSLFRKGDEIQFQVKDTGKGIGPEDRDAIFQKYSRGKESIRQSAGLGLGLYVAKIIVDEHQGKIWAESEGALKGSTFCFSLPIKSGLKQTSMIDLHK